MENSELYLKFDKSLYRISTERIEFPSDIDPSRIISGSSISTLDQVGTIQILSTGHIRGGQTAYNTGIGFFLGYATDAYKFSIGNPATSYLTWDGTALNIGGNATFAGTLSAAAGTLGAITIGSNAWHVDSSGNMWWGNYASYAAAVIKISAAGSVDFTTGNFSGTLSSGISINSPMITGGTLQTASSGKRVVISSTDLGSIKFYDANGNLRGNLDTDTLNTFKFSRSGDDNSRITMDSDGEISLNNSATSEPITLFAGAGEYFRIYTTTLPGADASYDLGSSSRKWKDIHLSGNITIDGTVDGIDISAHAGNANAHHAQSHTHASHTSIGASDHHNYLSDGLAITPTSIRVGAGNKIDIGYTNAYDILPYADQYGSVGTRNGYGGSVTTRRWAQIHGGSIVSGDLGFENKFHFTEEGLTGIALYNQKNKKIAVFMDNGDLLIKGSIKKL